MRDEVSILNDATICNYLSQMRSPAFLTGILYYTPDLLQIVPMNDFGMVRDELRRYLLYGFIYWPS